MTDGPMLLALVFQAVVFSYSMELVKLFLLDYVSYIALNFCFYD